MIVWNHSTNFLTIITSLMHFFASPIILFISWLHPWESFFHSLTILSAPNTVLFLYSVCDTFGYCHFTKFPTIFSMIIFHQSLILRFFANQQSPNPIFLFFPLLMINNTSYFLIASFSNYISLNLDSKSYLLF